MTRTNIGGPSVIVASLLADDSSPDISSTLVRGATPPDEGDFFENSALLTRVTTIPELGRRVKIWDDLRALVALVSHFRAIRPDVVHTHMAKAGALGRLAAIMAGVPVRVHTFHGHLLTGYFGGLTTRLVVAVERLLRMITTHSIVVGTRVREDLIAVNVVRRRRSNVINPGIDAFVAVDTSVARRDLALDPSTVTIMFVGRLARVKRPDRFVELARRFAKDQRLSFVVVGDGPVADDVKQRGRGLENLRFLPWQRDLPLLLGAADMVVICSENEGVPLLLIEAGMASIPVVCTRVGSVEDVLQDGVNGLVVDQDDEEALANAVGRLAFDPDLRARLGKAAREVVLRGFTSDTARSAHAELYRRLVTDARG